LAPAILVVNDGTNDFTDVIKGWNWLIGNTTAFDSASGRVTIQQSSRPLVSGKSFSTVWTSSGDDMATPALGAGTPLSLQTAVDTLKSSVIAEFHPNFGDVYLHEGYLMWANAGFGDYIDVEILAKATALQQVSSLDYEMDGNRVKYAAGGPGTGTHGLAGTPNLYPNKANTGYWDYDGANLTPAAGTGAYDFADIDIVVNRFFNKIMVNGTQNGYLQFESDDTTRLPTNYYVKLEAYNVSNTVWTVSALMTLYREQTA